MPEAGSGVLESIFSIEYEHSEKDFNVNITTNPQAFLDSFSFMANNPVSREDVAMQLKNNTDCLIMMGPWAESELVQVTIKKNRVEFCEVWTPR